MGLNHVYKVIWNKTKGCYVVVSEIAKRVGRNKVKAAVVQTGTVAAVLAVTSLTGSVAQAALNDLGTGNGIVAWGAESKANGNDSVAIGKGPTANGNYSVAIGSSTVAGNINAVAMGNQASATGDNATALGRGSKAERNDTVAVGNEAKASEENATAVGRASKATQNSAVAIGNSAEATATNSVALGKEAKATNNSSVAIGQKAIATEGDDTIAIGTKAGAKKDKSIAIGFEAGAENANSMAVGNGAWAKAGDSTAIGRKSTAHNTRSLAVGPEANAVGSNSVALGYQSTAQHDNTVAIGSNTQARGHGSIAMGINAKINNDAEGAVVIGRDAYSEGSGYTSRPGVVIGRGAYTAFGQNAEFRLNASTAVGYQAGAGLNVDPANNRKLVNNNTNADNNAEVLVKAGFGLDQIGGGKGAEMANTKERLKQGIVSNDMVFHRSNHVNEATAVGAEARALGDQSIAIGGQVVAGDGVVALGGNDTDALRGNKYQVATDDAVRRTNVSTIDDYNLAYTESTNTVEGQYNKLVGRGMPTAYKSTYGQSGSVVIGMEAHSTTALGVAIGTNSVVRMGAFGATAIGSGSTVQPNAEAAVAIGMGSVANGAYALAAGTASWAELGDIAMGYKAQASGKQGAIAIGQSTNAKGDSSVMIGGANISNAADQATTYEAERKNPDGSRVTYTKNVTERINGQNVTRKYTYVSTETKNGTVADAYAELTGKTMNTASLDYNDPKNRNGHASTSIGVHSLAKGDLASAYGASSRASAIGSLALGTGAIADKQNAVAIGTGSTTDLTGTRQLDASYDKEGKWVASDSPNAAYTFKWAGGLNTSEGDVVSFGSSGAERQLKNVAAGRIAEDSTDAINGSQVNAVIERFIGERVKYFSVNSTVEPNRQNDGATGTNAIAIGPNATATKTDGVATGNGATATGDRATAYGAGTTASAVNAVAVGSSVSVTEGTTTTEVATKADAANATALGAGAQATATDSTAVGTLSEAKAAEAIAIGAKAKSESAASVAIGQNAQVGAAATQGLALGQNATVSTVGGVALGTGSVASVASGVSGIGVDGEAEGTTRTNTYAKLHNNADNALTSGQGAVAIGGTSNNTPFTRQITGLAAGTNDTDAVNVAQLKSVNLAFKGNAGTGDVRLYDQRLTVESDNTNLLTVTASDKKLTLTPKTTSLTVDSTAGSTTLGKVTVPDATNNGLVTAADVANAINAAHWNVATDLVATATGAKHEGDSTAAVHAGETVKFIAGEHVTIHQDGRNITVSMKDAVTNIMVKDQIQSSFEDGNNTSFSLNPTTGKLRYDVSSTPTYTSITTGKTTLKDGVVTNLDSHLPNSDGPTVPKPAISDEVGKQAATVSDVMNAGWHLQNNGTAKDFVKPYDVVTFNDGASTTAVVNTSADKLTSTVTYNVTGLPITYTTATGAPVSKVGDKYYTVDESGTPVGPTGNKAVGKNAAGDFIDDAGNVIAPVNTATTPLKSNLVNPNVTNTTTAPNTSTTTPTQLGNVANGAATHNLLSEDGKELALANDGNYYEAAKVNPDGSPMTGVTTADAKTPVVLANDGKWYPKTQVNNRGDVIDKNTATPVIPPSIASAPTAGLVDFSKSNPNNAATVGDLQNMGWVVSASTGGYVDQVRNANQVDFIGKNGVTVSGETKNGIRTITIETAEEAVVFKGPDGTPLIKTDKGYFPADSVKIDGNYYPANTTKDPVTGNIVNNGAPAAPVTPVPKEDVVTSMNSNTPKTLNNVKNTLPNVNDETKTITTPDGQEQPNAGDVSNINRAPLTAAQAAELSNPKTADGQPNPNYKGSNAATVSDVLNAGWNLQTNGTALDFVKPYDTVNFADGGNTTVVSSTDGTTSKIQVNVTGLPVSNTVTDAQGNQVPVTKVGNTYFPVKADGTPDIQRDADGHPTNGYTIADDGNIYPSNQIDFIEQPDGTKTVTPRAGVNPTTINTNLANPNVPNGDPNKGVNTPIPLGNVANGANTHNPISTTGVPLKQAKDGKWYDATKVDDQGNPTPDAATFEGTPAVLANDGKWYPSNQVDTKGTPKADAQPITNPLTNQALNNGLINFANSNPNNAATVGDLQHMGWIVGAPGNNYADQVRNANQVNFVGKNLATVTGETDANGIRTITVDVQAQKTVETAHTPVVYTDSKGDKLTKLDNGKFYDANAVKALGNNITEVDGKLYPADAVKVGDKYYPAGTVVIDGTPYPQGSEKGPDGTITNPKGLDITEIEGVTPVTDAKASMNDTKGSTTNPFPLANVGSNLKQVVDPKENVPGQVNDKDGETKVGDKTNTAPYTAKDAANLVQKYELNDDGTVKTETVPVIDPETGKQKLDEAGNPVTEEKKVLNPNYIGNNAATVSDVLNAGWNLQNNGEARDFVKPYDTVNFVNGANTTAVVTTSEDGTTSKVTFNVTGLPVAYTDADGNKVAKIGDKYYKVNDKGQPLDEQGNPSTKVNDKGVPVNADGQEIPSVNVANTSLVNPTPASGKTSTTSPTALNNVTSNLSNYTEPVKNGLRNLDNKDVSNNTAATVGDLRNMGWIVSSDKKTGDLGNAYSDTVKNANEVKFVGTGAAVVSGNTVDGVRTITVNVDNQVATNNSITPVVYTDKNGNTVYPIKDEHGNVTYHTTPDGKGQGDTVVNNGDVVTSVNGPNGTKGENAPTTLRNVKNNIPTVDDKKKQAFNPDGTEATDPDTHTNTGNTKAPITAAKAQDLNTPYKVDDHGNYLDTDGNITTDPTKRVANPNYIGNNAATVSDVLSAGWNLQGNGTNVDFVKPYDTVNFRNGGNTTVTVTTDDNLTSHVQVNVTGLPVSNTITDPTTGKQVPVVKVGDAFYRANPDGTPNIERDTAGNPTNGYVRANDGKLYPRNEVTVTPTTNPSQPPTITPNAGATPTTVNTNLVNPNVDNTSNEPGNNVSTPTQLGNVANGAKTFNPVGADGKEYVKAANGKYYEPSKVNADGSLKDGTDATADAKNPLVLANDGKWYPADKVSDKGIPEAGATAVDNPLAPKNAAGEPLVQAKDGKWYKPSDLQPNGTPTPTAQPQDNTINNKAGLVDFSNSNPNNAATIGDLQNMGWVVSAQGNSYSDQVRNANEVKFVGEGTATVTGKTDANGVRTITVKVDDQVSTNNAVTPVVYTDKNGNTVYPIKDDHGNVTYHTTPDGKGQGDTVVPNSDVNTSINGPKDDKGNTRPASLGNVKNNIPAVNDADKKVTNADGTDKPNAGDVANINKAPLTAAEAADLLKPMKDGKANPNFVGNNAATVSDVLNAGWNLQGNGTNVDFVKPYDTVNFRNGGNTTVTVTTDDNLTSHVQVNVTGLPVSNTITDPTTGKQVPVVKVGDAFYRANPDGTPNIERDTAGNPTNGYVRANDGKLYPRNEVTVTPAADPAQPPTITPNAGATPTTVNTNLVNPNVDNTTDNPGNNVSTPNQLGNVANGAKTFDPVAADGAKLVQVGDKFYPADKVENGALKPGTDATADAKDPVKLANDGKWYKASDVEPNGKPKDGVTAVANPFVPKNATGEVLSKGNDGKWYKATELTDGKPKTGATEQTPVPTPANTDKTGKAGLVDFENSNPNNAATVGDLQNMGWVVSAKDNDYTDQVRNANKVEFKGINGVEVTGKTLDDGTREITVGLKEGKVTNDVTITKADGTITHAVRGEDGKIYEKDPVTGKAKPTEIPVADGDTVTNDGNSFVTGNNVATAIQKSGWNVGIGSTEKAFSTEAKTFEKVNPNDNVKYVNGANTTVSMAVDAAEDKDGTKVTTTYVKVDVNRNLNIDSVTTGGPTTDKTGKSLKLVNGEYYPENAVVQDGKAYEVGTTFIDGKPYPANTVMIDGKAYPAGSVKDPTTNAIVKDGQPATEVQPATPLTAIPKADLAPGKNGAMIVKNADGEDIISATFDKDGNGTVGVNGKDGNNTSITGDSVSIKDKDGNNTSKLTNTDLVLNSKDPKTGVEKTSHMSGDKLSFNTTDEIEKDPVTHKPVIDPKTNQPKIKTPGNSTEYTNDGLKVIPNSTVTRDANGNPTFLDKDGKPVMKDIDGEYKYMGQDGKPGESYTQPVGALKPNVVDNTRVISFGMDKPVLDSNGNPMKGPDGNPIMTEGISAGMQQIHNVAPGTKDTDAVNVSQLKGVSNMVVNINGRMNRLGAQAAAMAGLRHLQYDPLEPTTIMAGIGTYKGETALALGIAHYKNESTLFHAGASIGSHGDELMANAGVSWKFGARADETAVKDTFRQGPISASYTLQDKVSALEAQNQLQKDEINELKAQLAEVLKYIKKG